MNFKHHTSYIGRKILPIILLTICAIAPSCDVGNASQVSGGLGLEAFENMIRSEWRYKDKKDSLIKIITFKKANGVASVHEGVSRYRFDYDAEVEFTESATVYWLKGGFIYVKTFGGAFATDPPPLHEREFEKLSRVRITGSILFEKTERGWKKIGISKEIKSISDS